VAPLFSETRAVVGAYARKVNDQLRAGTPKHLYLPGPHRGVFNREGIEGQAEIILCEALIDALTFWAAGYRNVTSSYGVNGFTDEMLAAFKTCGAQRVLIAFDRDEAGDRAAEALAKRLAGEGFDCFRLLFPKGEDANSYALTVKPAEKALGLVIRSAEWMGTGTKPKLTTCSNPTSAPSEPQHIAVLPEPAAEALPTHELPDAVLPCAALPSAAPLQGAAPQEEGEQVQLCYGERRYRVRGLPKQLSEALKVNVLVSTQTEPNAAGPQGLHVDTFDLYQAKQRQAFARLAASELRVEESVIQHDLGRLLLKLEQLIEARAKAAEVATPAPAKMSPEETQTALSFLKDPTLIARIIADIERAGLVGEPSNALVAYLACVSRKLAAPLAVLIQSTSAAGKSALMDAVLALVPTEERVHYSAMTGQSLFYLGETDLKHRVLAIAEEEGVRQAAYALKVLQSQGELTIASTGKDPASGMLVTQQYRVEGPVMLFLTTTAIDVDEELVNRCLVLTIDESREQTKLIQQRQRARRTLAGLAAGSEARTIEALHQNAQRLLRPLAVVNPYAEALTFLDDRTRTRRDHAKYLTLIDAIALLHQHQREIKTLLRHGQTIEYLEVTLEDIALANTLAHEVLGRSLDELPPQTRRVLGSIEAWVAERITQHALPRSEARFTRRELRARCGMSDTALRIHLERLVAMEYVRPVMGRNGQRFEYELLFDGDLERTAPQMIGLIDAATLRAASAKTDTTIATSQGLTPDLAPTLQGARTPLAPTLQGHRARAASSLVAPSSAAE